jgi:transcriptional regulator with XRE-family HTH domain
MASSPNVIPRAVETFPKSLFGKPSRRAYRAAIKEIILNIQSQKKWTALELADFLGCHKDTVENVLEENSSLDIITLLNIAYAFGEQAIAPVRELYLCAPTDRLTKNDHIRKAREHLNIAEAMEE